MEITTVYQKERHEFGRSIYHFSESEVTILDEFMPDSDLRGEHIERNPTILDVQAIPEMSETYVRGSGRTRSSHVGVLRLCCSGTPCCCCRRRCLGAPWQAVPRCSRRLP
jgi:hypothetical protein